MHVVENRPDRLVLHHRPTLLPGGLFALAIVPFWIGLSIWPDTAFGTAVWFASAGLVAATGFVSAGGRRLVFDRASGQVEIARAGLFHRHHQTLALADVIGATVQARIDTDPDALGVLPPPRQQSPLWRPVLIVGLAEATVPLVDMFLPGEGASRTVAVVNGWLAGRAPGDTLGDTQG